MENNNKRQNKRSWRLLIEKEHSERNVTKEKTKKKLTVTVANLTPDDRDAKRKTTCKCVP